MQYVATASEFHGLENGFCGMQLLWQTIHHITANGSLRSFAWDGFSRVSML